jgi:hypothetical protein
MSYLRFLGIQEDYAIQIYKTLIVKVSLRMTYGGGKFVKELMVSDIFNGYAVCIAVDEISNDVTQVFTGPSSLPSCSYRKPSLDEEIPIEVATYSLKLLDEKMPFGIFDFNGVKYLLFHKVS